MAVKAHEKPARRRVVALRRVALRSDAVRRVAARGEAVRSVATRRGAQRRAENQACFLNASNVLASESGWPSPARSIRSTAFLPAKAAMAPATAPRAST